MKEYKFCSNIKLTNWQVPKNPKTEIYDFFKEAAPIDMKKYEIMGSVEHHDSTETVVEKMIIKNEIKSGRKLSTKPEKTQEYNLNGINDDRKDKGEKLQLGVK